VTGRLLVQIGRAKRHMSECDFENSTIRRPRTTWAVESRKRNEIKSEDVYNTIGGKTTVEKPNRRWTLSVRRIPERY